MKRFNYNHLQALGQELTTLQSKHRTMGRIDDIVLNRYDLNYSLTNNNMQEHGSEKNNAQRR
jgi:hypothetical protein